MKSNFKSLLTAAALSGLIMGTSAAQTTNTSGSKANQTQQDGKKKDSKPQKSKDKNSCSGKNGCSSKPK